MLSKDVLSFLGIGLLTGLFAVATIIGTAMRLDKDPAIDGPRALTAEFFGLWFAFAFLAFSFMVEGATTQWIFRGIAASAALIGFIFAAFFAGTPEVRVRLDQEPTGFEAPSPHSNSISPRQQKTTPSPRTPRAPDLAE